jgi:hypothetical protein
MTEAMSLLKGIVMAKKISRTRGGMLGSYEIC